MGEDLLDSDDNSKCRDLSRPRPNARYPRSRQLRFVARSGDEGREHGVRTAKALRCPAHAVLRREHADQPCGDTIREVADHMLISPVDMFL
jgi:hypothetical protein